MRRMPEIPRDVFFGETATDPGATSPAPRPLRPVDDTTKVQVTVYLSEPTAKQLEVLRFHLLNDHDIKVSKSAIAEFAINQLGDDLDALVRFFGVGER